MKEDVTRMINAIQDGDPDASEELLPLVYGELRRLATQKMANERAGHTLQPTALVHEAYLRLVNPADSDQHWDGRGHFFAAAAEAMRRILVESARRKYRKKRGGDRRQTTLDESMLTTGAPPDEILAVDEALERLEEESPKLAQVVKLRYFAGLTVAETAAVMAISTSSVDRQWAGAKAWLFRELDELHRSS